MGYIDEDFVIFLVIYFRNIQCYAGSNLYVQFSYMPSQYLNLYASHVLLVDCSSDFCVLQSYNSEYGLEITGGFAIVNVKFRFCTYFISFVKSSRATVVSADTTSRVVCPLSTTVKSQTNDTGTICSAVSQINACENGWTLIKFRSQKINSKNAGID